MSGLNFLIAQGQGINLAGAVQSAENVKNTQGRNRLLGLTTDQFERDQPKRDADQQQQISGAELKSVIQGATELKPFLDAGDIDGANRTLSARLRDLKVREQETGVPVNTQGTENAIRLLNVGTPEALKRLSTVTDGLVEQGQQFASRNVSATNVQSTFVDENGDLNIVRRDGTVENTGKKPSESMRFTTNAAGEQTLVDFRGANAGQNPIKVTSRDEGLGNIHDGANAAETGKQNAQTAAIPAQSEAELNAELAETQVHNKTTFDVYETGMGELMRALGETSTGPFVGMLPALSSNQQISDGAIAAMAPVLKQMFRAAGEGIFTDKDQALLLEMVPDRTDHAETIAAKFRNIDAIVRAKLKIPQDQSGGPQGSRLSAYEQWKQDNGKQ